MTERIMTLHPQNKEGVNIEKAKYDVVAEAILEALAEGDMTFQALVETMNVQLVGRLDGSINWYTTTIKLDLEARGHIARIPGSSPQVLHRIES